ncbi:hypothetical protein PS862_04348 [Pseudomonas fluorescens]|uniref:Uncharacterized protein n=1 Tax=Pseudomonas fluorescens TaxID=294 RepID=A0A5E6XXX7_PSEFL|nr:hypothetical protein [Pseudomonas fluorescens]VVN46388.1 hypothetical protein PS639_05786 [Pseudomonas fluorescens]VVP30665.1 hypothetical protein PS862_04348 [Pseudomonas fluorescens]
MPAIAILRTPSPASLAPTEFGVLIDDHGLHSDLLEGMKGCKCRFIRSSPGNQPSLPLNRRPMLLPGTAELVSVAKDDKLRYLFDDAFLEISLLRTRFAQTEFRDVCNVPTTS